MAKELKTPVFIKRGPAPGQGEWYGPGYKPLPAELADKVTNPAAFEDPIAEPVHDGRFTAADFETDLDSVPNLQAEHGAVQAGGPQPLPEGWRSLKADEVKQLASDRGIVVAPNATKDDVVQLLERQSGESS